MSTLPNALRAYQHVERTAHSPHITVARALEDAARCMEQAAQASERNEIENRYKLTLKATLLLSALGGGIDDSYSSEIAKTFKDYYVHMGKLITRVNFNNDAQLAREVAASFQQMAVFWREIGSNS